MRAGRLKDSTTQYIFGLHPVLSLLKKSPESIVNLYILAGKDDEHIRLIKNHANKNSLKINELKKNELNSLVNFANHQGIVAVVQESSSGHTEDDLATIIATASEPVFLLILDGVQDPHNLGACLRTANAAGVHAVIAPRDNAVGLTPVVHKVASGAVNHTPFIQVTNLYRTLRWLKEQGVWMIGTDERATETIYTTDCKIPLALVLGAEGSGLRRLTKENCDFLVRLPMRGVVPSLNVSVAAGICMFEVVRQRTN